MNKYITIIIIFIVIISILSIYQGCSLQSSISTIKSDIQTSFDSIKAKKSETYKLDFKKAGKNQVIINEEGLKRINEQIQSLNRELEKQSIQLESTIDRDISRLAIYMAVGIGFMTLAGIFVPILVNVLSFQDLRDKQNGIDAELKTIKSDLEEAKKQYENISTAITNSGHALEKSQTALEKSNSALEKTQEVDSLIKKQEEIESKAKDINSVVCNLTLHNTIARFFNIRPLILTEAINKKDNKIFITHLEQIQKAFANCASEENHLIKGADFQQTIDDFIIFLKTESILQSLLVNKAIFKNVEALAITLIKFSDIEEKDKKEQYSAVNDKIELLKNCIQNQHSQNSVDG